MPRHWEYVAGELRSRFHVLALDQRGHGDSEWAPVYGSQPMVDDLAAFVDTLGLDKVSIIGMSMGGMNALLYTAKNPDRVDRLVLGDIGPEIAPAGVARIRAQVASRDTFASIDEAYEIQLANNPRATPWALRQRVEHNVKELPDGTFTWKYDRALRDGSASRIDTPSDEQWEQLAGDHGPDAGRARRRERRPVTRDRAAHARRATECRARDDRRRGAHAHDRPAGGLRRRRRRVARSYVSGSTNFA